MKPWKALLFALIWMCASLPLLAQDNVTFTNQDGTFTGSGLNSGDLSLGSTLTGISGFTGSMAGYNTSGLNLGSFTFATGNLISGSMVPLTGQISTFGSGGAYNVTDTFNGGFGGFTFTGTFLSGETWQCSQTCHLVTGHTNEWKGTWTFIGNLANAVLTIDGQQFTASNPITIQGSTTKGIAVMNNGQITFADQSGFTHFNGNFPVSPEPGTLTLFGTGLIAVGVLTKYGRSRKLNGSTSTDS